MTAFVFLPVFFSVATPGLQTGTGRNNWSDYYNKQRPSSEEETQITDANHVTDIATFVVYFVQLAWIACSSIQLPAQRIPCHPNVCVNAP